MAFTKIVGAGIHTLSNVHTHNINSSGIITATSFVGPLDGTTGDFSGNVTIDGNLVVNGTTTTLDTNLTEVDKVEVAANNSTVGVAITQSGSGDLLRLYDGTSQVVTVDDEGNVGIGTNTLFTSGAHSGTHQLTVTGNAPSMILGVSNNDQLYIRRELADGKFTFQSVQGGGNNGVISLQPYGGNVGIASLTPSAKLDIVEATSIAAVKIKSGTNTNQNASLTFSNDNGGGLMHLGVFGSGASTYGTNEANDGFISAMQQLSINSQNASGEIRFGVGVPPTTKLSINSAGLVTIPGDLDVDGHTELDNVNVSGIATVGGFQVDHGSSSNQVIDIKTTATSGASRIRFMESGSDRAELTYSHDNDLLELIGMSGNGISLITNGYGNERVRITSAGDVGIGEASPTTKLDVRGGSILVDGFNTSGDHGIFFRPGFTVANSNSYNLSIIAYDHSGANKDGLSINAHDGVSFCTGSNTRNQRVLIDENGKFLVGIHTTSANYGWSSKVRFATETTGDASSIHFGNSTNPGIIMLRRGGSTAWVHHASKIYTDHRPAIHFETAYGAAPGSHSFQHHMTMKFNAGVGIGTVDPSEKLHVTVPDNQRQTMLRLQHIGQRNFYIQGQQGSADVGGSNGILQFVDGGHLGFRVGSSGNVQLMLDQAGKVGIHTNDPQSLLHLYDGQPIIRLTKSDGAADNRHWNIGANTANLLRIQALNDSNSGGGTLFDIYRSGNNVNEFRAMNGGGYWFALNNGTKKIVVGDISDIERKVDIQTGNGESVLIRPNTGGNNTQGNANVVNNLLIMRMPYGDNAATSANAGARLGIVFTGRNDGASYVDNPSKSAAVYGVSEDTSAGYNRQMGLAFYTSQFDQAQAEKVRITATGNLLVNTTGSSGAKIQINNHTFSGSHYAYSNDRVGFQMNGGLKALALCSTYNDANHPEYGLVFVHGPTTSSYNNWGICPDGPAKGNSLNFHYGAQATNIHTTNYRKFSFTGEGFLIKPSHPSFRATREGTTIDITATAIQQWNTVSGTNRSFDRYTAGGYGFNTSTYKYKVPVTGVWFFHAAVYTNTGLSCMFDIKTSTQILQRAEDNSGSNMPNNNIVHASCVVTCNKDDEVYVEQSGGQCQMIAGGGYISFDGHFIG